MDEDKEKWNLCYVYPRLFAFPNLISMKFDQLFTGMISLNTQQSKLLDTHRNHPGLKRYLEAHDLQEIPGELNALILTWQKEGQLDAYLQKTERAWAKFRREAAQIRTVFQSKNKWSERLKVDTDSALTTQEDLDKIDQLCEQFARRKRDADAILVHFFRSLLRARKAMAKETSQAEVAPIPDDWYKAPWYYIYVQYFGTDEHGQGGFRQLTGMLNYLEQIGIRNIYILPHYESPQGDAGYDISAYKPARSYGGMRAFRTFMQEARARGFRVATDLVFNHTSVAHRWFRECLNGNPDYFRYYLKCPDNWRQLSISDILRDEDGDLYLYLPDTGPQGEYVVSKRILIFPDVDQTLWLERPVDGLEETVLFYREFYPFQVDLDIQRPRVMRELFDFLAEEVQLGILGKRTDAVAHWVKKPGTYAKNLPETYALQKLIKQFLKHLNPRTIILPEVVTTSRELKQYAGPATTILGRPTTTGGDALLDFQLQGMMREMIYFQKTTPFWNQVYELGQLESPTATLLLPIEHHDETYMGFIQEIEAMRHYLSERYTYLDTDQSYRSARRGIIYKNGMSAGARYADALNRDVRRIANAIFCLYLMPATPVIYYGTEIGAANDWQQMESRQRAQFETMQALLGPEKVGPGKTVTFADCADPRELQRGPIAADRFYRALKESYPPTKLLAALNEIRQRYSALRHDHFSPVDSYHESILAMIKYPPGPAGPGNPPLLALSNLAERTLTARLPMAQLRQLLSLENFRFRRILKMEGAHPQRAHLDKNKEDWQPTPGSELQIELPPYSAQLWEIQGNWTAPGQD